jgi:cystathionine beta-lyase/cystathionine gamma-synthase
MMKHISTRRTPIYRDSAFIFENIEQCQQTFQAETHDPQSADNLIYTRYGNPTVMETEQTIAAVENSVWAVLTSSGMSAIDVAVSVFQKQGETGKWLFFSEIYGGTNTYITQVLEQRRGLQITRFAPKNGTEKYALRDLTDLLEKIKPQLLYFEPVSNPLLIVADGKDILKLAKERGIKIIVDNTFATPYLWRPLQDGADLVVHSATKYFSGHGNITAGVVCGNDHDLRKDTMAYRKFVGHILSPDDAYRLGTQLDTFELRISRQCENAFKLAKTLQAHPRIEHVRYPGLESHMTHQEALKLFGKNGFGAMVTFDLKGGRNAAETFIANVARHVKFVPTLGDPQSILIHVPTVFTPERFPYPGMFRFSVGFEPYEELEASVLKALDAFP